MLAKAELALAALALLAVLICAAVVAHYVHRYGAGVVLWRWVSGNSMDGGRCKTGEERRQRRRRAARRDTATILIPLTVYGLATARTLTIAAAAAAAALILAPSCVLLIWNWRHHRHYVRPLERTLVSKLRDRPDTIDIALDDDGVITGVAIEWPADAEIGTPEKQLVLEAVTTRLAIEAPEPSWKLTGRNRAVTFTRSDPPPFPVSWADVAAAVASAAPGELVFGLGKRAVPVKAAYGESPHLQIPGGSGGGKSNLAAFLLLQELMRGTLVFNLDPKWISHLWLQDLPNVINAHDTEDLHVALCWLGRELKRRTKAAWYSAAGTGRVRARPGCRVVVLAEELNYGMDGLKDLWREIRTKEDPKQSPAVAGLKALSCAGRASDMHEWLVAQLMTVESTGVRDSSVRTNAGIKAMARWDEPGWKMSVGKHIPMPPQTDIPGRIQVVTGKDAPRETQVPYLHLDDEDPGIQEAAVRWARELAVSGTVAQIPSGPEGVPPRLWPASVRRTAPLALPPGQGAGTGETVAPADGLTIAEAVASGIFGPLNLGAARRRVGRAGIRNTGRRSDGSYTYARADLLDAARDGRRKELAS